MTILALLGNKEVGKTTLAEYLATKWGYKHLAFADTIYHQLGIKPVSGNKPIELRNLLEAYGAYCKYAYGESYFADITLSKAEGFDKIVFSDLRFLVEADAILNKYPNAKLICLGQPDEYECTDILAKYSISHYLPIRPDLHKTCISIAT